MQKSLSVKSILGSKSTEPSGLRIEIYAVATLSPSDPYVRLSALLSSSIVLNYTILFSRSVRNELLPQILCCMPMLLQGVLLCKHQRGRNHGSKETVLGHSRCVESWLRCYWKHWADGHQWLSPRRYWWFRTNVDRWTQLSLRNSGLDINVIRWNTS